ncbi:MAG: HAD family hydrolase [Acetobacteraceae bacterium]
MPERADLVFLFDVDNTLLDNDRVQQDLDVYLSEEFGDRARARYWAIFEDRRTALGYADYLGALELYRSEDLHDPRLLRMASWLVDYPFAERLFPGALAAVAQAARLGQTVILSDGDAVFQPRKVERSGLWRTFENRVLIYIHKEEELPDVERLYPARRYVLIDDKLRILAAVKKAWGAKVVTVFPRQGRYALDAGEVAKYPPADIAIERIAEFDRIDPKRFMMHAEEAPS